MDGQPKKKNWWEYFQMNPNDYAVTKESQVAMGGTYTPKPTGVVPGTTGTPVTAEKVRTAGTPVSPYGAASRPTQQTQNLKRGVAQFGSDLAAAFTATGGPKAAAASTPVAPTTVTWFQPPTTTSTGVAGTTETGTTETGTTETGTAEFKPMFSAQDIFNTQTELANQVRAYQDLVATNASEEQKRALAQQIRRSELAYQQARQQISEQDFLQQRQLMQGAAARGLGGSGLEQLGRTQARMQTGQQLNQLSQQYGDQLQGYLNTQLGIESKLAEALAGNALTEMGNINEAQLTALNQEWTQAQQAWTVEDRQKFDVEQAAAHFADLFASLQEAGDNAQQREVLRQTYSKLLPPDNIDRLFNMTSPTATGDTIRNVSSNVMGTLAPTNSSERASFNAAMAQDEGDGKLSRLKSGNTTMYFPNDKALLAHVTSLYANRENADKIQIVIKGGGVRYITSDGQEFDTYNKASNAIG